MNRNKQIKKSSYFRIVGPPNVGAPFPLLTQRRIQKFIVGDASPVPYNLATILVFFCIVQDFAQDSPGLGMAWAFPAPRSVASKNPEVGINYFVQTRGGMQPCFHWSHSHCRLKLLEKARHRLNIFSHTLKGDASPHPPFYRHWVPLKPLKVDSITYFSITASNKNYLLISLATWHNVWWCTVAWVPSAIEPSLPCPRLLPPQVARRRRNDRQSPILVTDWFVRCYLHQAHDAPLLFIALQRLFGRQKVKEIRIMKRWNLKCFEIPFRLVAVRPLPRGVGRGKGIYIGI